jgi:hypothetical protein
MNNAQPGNGFGQPAQNQPMPQQPYGDVNQGGYPQQPMAGQQQPQQPMAYSGMPGAMMPPVAPKKKKTGLIIGLVIGGIVLLIVLAIVLVLVFFNSNTKEGDTFVNALIIGDTATAYAQFSPELQAVQSQSTFEDGVSTLGLQSSCEMAWNSTSVQTTTQGTTKDMSGTLACPVATYSVTLTYLEQNEEYKLIQYEIK